MKRNALSALKEKAFAYLWIGEIFIQISTNLFNFFLILFVYKITESNIAVSGAVLSFTIPAILFGSIAGVYVDHWNKKKVMIFATVIRAILVLLMIVYLNNIVMIYLISLLISILVQFFIPAEVPIIPLTVTRKNLLSANALFGVALFGSVLLAYILSGPLLLLLGDEKLLFVLAVMLLIGAFFVFLIKIKNPTQLIRKKDNKKFNFLNDFRHTLFLVSKAGAVSKSLFLLALSQVLVLVVATLAPGYASQVLNIRVEEFPALFAAPAALGMVFGAIFVGDKYHSRPKKGIIRTGIILSGIAMSLLPYGSEIASRDIVTTINSYLPQAYSIDILSIMGMLAFLLGISNAFVFVPANTILQERTKDEVRGKIYGFLNSIIGAVSLLPVIVAGGLSDAIGVSVVITGIGFSLVAFGILTIFVKKI